jgi:hypothetical protein
MICLFCIFLGLVTLLIKNEALSTGTYTVNKLPYSGHPYASFNSETIALVVVENNYISWRVSKDSGLTFTIYPTSNYQIYGCGSAFSPDGNVTYISQNGQTPIYRVDLNTRAELISSWTTYNSWIAFARMACSYDGQYVVAAGSNYGKDYYDTGIITFSSNYGATFQSCNFNNDYSDVVLMSFSGAKIIALNMKNIAISIDYCSSFSIVNTFSTYTYLAGSAEFEYIYFIADNKVFRSTNLLSTWTPAKIYIY